MAEPLSPADRSALNSEKPPVNMAVAGLVVLDPGPGVTHVALTRRIAERVHLLPRYRRRLETGPLGAAQPVWVDDEHFDVEWHVRQTTLPAPGGAAELDAVVAREASRLMDRSRPLWELHLIEGLADGKVAVMPKMHHALVDGAAAVGVGMVLLDPSEEPVPVDAAPDEWEPEPYRLRRHVRALARQPLARVYKLGLETTERVLDLDPRTAASDVRAATELVAALARQRPSAPRLPFNRRISANRRYAMASAPLETIKRAGKAAGGTVNDAILAVVSGMLARYLSEAGVDAATLPRDPVALVPVNVRRDDDAAGGNRISVVMVDLPVGEPDPAARIGVLAQRMIALKGSAAVRAGALLLDVNGLAPPLVSSAIARAAGGASAFNLVVSNVPGPQMPLWMNGSRVHAIHPVVPLNPADQGLNVGVFSYDGRVCFGLTADARLEPGVDRAAAALEAAAAELSDR